MPQVQGETVSVVDNCITIRDGFHGIIKGQGEYKGNKALGPLGHPILVVSMNCMPQTTFSNNLISHHVISG